MRILVLDKDTHDIDCVEAEGLLYEAETRELSVNSSSRSGIYVIHDMAPEVAADLLVKAYKEGKLNLREYPAVYEE